VSLTFVPRQTGVHILSVTPKRCEDEPCQVGAQILQTDATYDTGPESPVAHLVR